MSERVTWKKQRKPSSLRALAEHLEEIRDLLVRESEKTAAQAEAVAKEALKRRG
tara:strand:+ start:955 stop:1116 length:162 start_codon:yes stop_codon:yes gene_type:complete